MTSNKLNKPRRFMQLLLGPSLLLLSSLRLDLQHSRPACSLLQTLHTLQLIDTCHHPLPVASSLICSKGAPQVSYPSEGNKYASLLCDVCLDITCVLASRAMADLLSTMPIMPELCVCILAARSSCVLSRQTYQVFKL